MVIKDVKDLVKDEIYISCSSNIHAIYNVIEIEEKGSVIFVIWDLLTKDLGITRREISREKIPDLKLRLLSKQELMLISEKMILLVKTFIPQIYAKTKEMEVANNNLVVILQLFSHDPN